MCHLFTLCLLGFLLSKSVSIVLLTMAQEVVGRLLIIGLVVQSPPFCSHVSVSLGKTLNPSVQTSTLCGRSHFMIAGLTTRSSFQHSKPLIKTHRLVIHVKVNMSTSASLQVMALLQQSVVILLFQKCLLFCHIIILLSFLFS